MARIGVLNIAPEVDFACHEYEARNGNLIPNSPTAFGPRSADAVAAGGPVRMDHEGQHADQGEAEGRGVATRRSRAGLWLQYRPEGGISASVPGLSRG